MNASRWEKIHLIGGRLDVLQELGSLVHKTLQFPVDMWSKHIICHRPYEFKNEAARGRRWGLRTGNIFFWTYLSGRFCTIIVLSILQPLIQPLHCTAFRPTATNSKNILIAVSKFYKKHFLLSFLCFNYEHISVPSMCDLFIEDTDLCDSIIICGRINSS